MNDVFASNTPRISVILPVYNGEAYIVDAVSSVLNQDFQDFELIIIDDGSTDKSLSLIKKLQQTDARIQLQSRANKGLVASLNEGITLARGSWIARMDADDIALPNRFSKQLSWLETTGADICGSWFKPFGRKRKKEVRLPVSDQAIKTELLFNCPFAHPTVMIRKKVLEDNFYDRNFEAAEDYHLWVKLAQQGYLMTNVPEVLLHYREHANQITMRMDRKQASASQQSRELYWEHFLKSSDMTSDDAKAILDIYHPETPLWNFASIEQALCKLISSTSDEASDIIFNRAQKIFMQCAASNGNLTDRWRYFNQINNRQASLSSIICLRLISFLKISPSSQPYKQLKDLYQITSGR